MFYVYELIDPRTDRVFYVGKGTRNRCLEHFRNAKNGHVGLRFDLIREILEAGICILPRIVRRFMDESKAYIFEQKLIAKHGLQSLTNVSKGGRYPTREEIAKRRQERDLLKATARMFKVFAKHEEIGFWYGGTWHGIKRERAITIADNSVRRLLGIFGETECKALFLKHGVDIQING